MIVVVIGTAMHTCVGLHHGNAKKSLIVMVWRISSQPPRVVCHQCLQMLSNLAGMFLLRAPRDRTLRLKLIPRLRRTKM